MWLMNLRLLNICVSLINHTGSLSSVSFGDYLAFSSTFGQLYRSLANLSPDAQAAILAYEVYSSSQPLSTANAAIANAVDDEGDDSVSLQEKELQALHSFFMQLKRPEIRQCLRALRVRTTVDYSEARARNVSGTTLLRDRLLNSVAEHADFDQGLRHFVCGRFGDEVTTMSPVEVLSQVFAGTAPAPPLDDPVEVVRREMGWTAPPLDDPVEVVRREMGWTTAVDPVEDIRQQMGWS